MGEDPVPSDRPLNSLQLVPGEGQRLEVPKANTERLWPGDEEEHHRPAPRHGLRLRALPLPLPGRHRGKRNLRVQVDRDRR